jgi:hypothetical protein
MLYCHETWIFVSTFEFIQSEAGSCILPANDCVVCESYQISVGSKCPSVKQQWRFEVLNNWMVKVKFTDSL